MKSLFRNLLICLISILSVGIQNTLYAQATVSDMNDELHQLYSVLKKPVNQQFWCQSNFLWDMTTTVSDDYKGNLGIDNITPSFDWYSQYFEFKNRAYSKTLLPPTLTLNSTADEIYEKYRKVAIGVMDFSYHEFKDDAFDKQGNYFDWDDDKIWDVAGRALEPYKTLPNGDYNLPFFKCAPLIDSVKYRKVNYQFNPNLIFYGPQYSCHYWPAPNHQFQVNFGSGWQTINTSVLTDITIIYPSKGNYKLSFRILGDGFISRSTDTYIVITGNELEPTPPTDRLSIAGAKINIYNPCSAFDNTNYKPLIYVSGIDLSESKHVDELYDEFILKGDLQNLDRNGYKIYVVDWKNSRQSLLTNAETLVEIINYINAEMKDAGNPNQIVILGSSIGGIISRYAVTSMEDNHGNAWHNCRLLVTLDSPHQGANVPLGLQHIAAALIGFTGLNPAFSGMCYYLDKKAHFAFLATELLDQPAVLQMLTYHINSKTILSEYPPMDDRTSFLTELYTNNPYTKGYPNQCRVILISNGTMDDTRQMRFGGGPVNPGDLLFGIGASVKVTVFKKISFKVFDWSIDTKSMPDGMGAVLEIPFSLYSIKMIGCVGRILRALWRPNTFISTIMGCINSAVTLGSEYAINVKDIDGMTGGNASYIPFGKTLSTYSPSFNLGGILSGYAGILVENPHPCFVPTYSALDFNGPMGPTANIPDHINFTQIPIHNIVNSNGATVFMSSYANWIHNQWGEDIDIPVLTRTIIKPKEIAPENMRLDNYNLTRRAYFESKYSIVAGIKIFSNGFTDEYTYPSTYSPNYNLPLTKENGFIIGEVLIATDMPLNWSYVSFKAGNQIVLKPGFSSGLGSRFHAYLYNEPECPQQMMKNPDPSTPIDSDFYLHKVQLVSISQNTFIPPIERELNPISLKVWPNPAQSLFTVLVSNLTGTEQPIITLVNMQGEITPVQLDASSADKTNRVIIIKPIEYGLTAGIYAIQVQCNGKNYTTKIFIQP